MKPKTLILMLVAVGCGLVAAMLAIQMGPGATANQNTVPVLVAAVNLPPGTPIKDPAKQLVLKMYAQGTEPPGSHSNPVDLLNKVPARALEVGTPVTDKDMNNAQDLFKPAPDGYRAVTIRATLESAHAGFTLPGSHVDLICTGKEGNSPRIWTFTFLEDVLVLAVNTLRNQPGAEQGGVVATPTSLTLALKPEDAQKVYWATSQGTISTALRKPGDEKIAKPKPTGSIYVGFGDGGTGEGDGGMPMSKVWVAKETINPGKTIDKVDDYFELMNVPKVMAGDAYTESQKDDLNQARVAHLIVKGFPVTHAHFLVLSGTERVVGNQGGPKRQTFMRIFEVDTLKDTFTFEDGKSIDKDGNGANRGREPVVAPVPAPPAPTPEPGAKPTEPPTERKS